MTRACRSIVLSRLATVSRHAKMRAFKLSQASNQFIVRLLCSSAGDCQIGASICTRGAKNWDKARLIGSPTHGAEPSGAVSICLFTSPVADDTPSLRPARPSTPESTLSEVDRVPGRFAEERGAGIALSATDGSNVKSNRCRYGVVMPEAQR